MSRIPSPILGRKAAGVLALHKIDGAFRYVIAAPAAAGNGATTLRVTDSGSFPAGDAKALEAVRSKAGGATLVQVIPATAAIHRAAPPKLALDGPPEQVAAALALVAEAELPTTVPAHRRAAGVIRAGHAHAVYAVGWIGPEGELVPGAVAVPAVAAVAALHRLTGSPDGVALCCNESTGIVGLVAAGKGESPRLLVRILKDDPSDDKSFDAVRDEALDDACAELGLDQPVRLGKSLALPQRPAPLGIPGDDRLAEFALAVGAAAAALDPRPDEQPLFTMTDRSPQTGRSVFTRLGDALSTPRAAAVTAAACAVLLLAGWIVAAPIKLAILQSRIGADAGDTVTKALQQHEWYKTLRDRRWPMTALLAELASSAPEGVRIESLSIEQGRPITVTGTADTAESLDKWRASLQGKVFAEVTPTIPDESATPIRFTITARVQDPIAAAVSELKPVANADAPRPQHTDTPARSDGGSRPDRTSRAGGGGGNGGNGGAGNGGTRNSGRSGNGSRTATPAAPAPTVETPGPLSDAQIDKLDKGKVLLEWAKRQSFLNAPDLDPALRNRIEHERDRLEARKNTLLGGGH